MVAGGRPFRGTAAATDLYDTGNAQICGTMVGAKLCAGAAAAAAQLVDADGTVLGDLAAPANGEGWLNLPVAFRGKVRINTLTGAGAIVNVWIQ